jgi:hypothetical protein
MASISDVFNALNDIKGKLDQLHADEITEHGKLDAVVNAVNTAPTGITSRLDQLVGAETQAAQIALHMPRQNEAILCAIEHVSRNTCELVMLADRQLEALHGVQASTRTSAEILRTVHADASLELDRRDELQARVDKCCPPEPRKPRCGYDRCEDPGPFQRHD